MVEFYGVTQEKFYSTHENARLISGKRSKNFNVIQLFICSKRQSGLAHADVTLLSTYLNYRLDS